MRPIPFLPGRTDFEKLDAILQVSANSGYSIPNVHQRVQLLFGADYGLSYGRSPSGTTASLHSSPGYNRECAEQPW